ncbi:MAG: phosphoribosylformylglycinamidine synthase subunit PurL, partial [Saprospiraceae bacterium]|nr:phosphoribosylformylglycinamidine synthase subunit PurL [Saprospiraceae bacterium]
IDLDKAPTRQANMKPFEILLSESQERMLIVGVKGREAELKAVFDKWDLVCEQIGEVTDTRRLEFYFHGEKVADVPTQELVLGGGAPVYKREYTKPEYLRKNAQFKSSAVPRPENYIDTARRLFASPNLVSKRWIYEQYDSMVRTGSMSTNKPSDAALVWVKGTKKALALTTDCNAAYVYADAYIGTMIAVAEAARNIVCSGGEPVAITNCLNFGNPYNPEVYWQFVNAIKGMGDACRKFDTPVTGGNVSFYNQSVFKDRTEPVYPTPTIGMLGILDDTSLQTGMYFQESGNQIYMLGTPHNDLGSSEYLRVIHNIQHSPPPHFDLDEEYHLQQQIKALIRKRMVRSAHDVSEGGLFGALLECAMVEGLGFDVETDSNFRKDAYLFGESQSRVIISVKPEMEDELVNHLNAHNVSFSKLGEVKGDRMTIDGEDYGSVASWKQIYDNTLAEVLEK